MKERLLEFLTKENKSAAQFAEEIGVQPSGISHILSGRNKPSLDFVLKMLEKYPHLSTEWLLFGKGGMYREESLQELFDTSGFDRKTSIDNDKQLSYKEMDDYHEPDKADEINITRKKRSLRIEKIIWFYSDNSFREFTQGEE